MPEIDKIRDEWRTEDAKLEIVADYLAGEYKPTFDRVLENGSTATHKTAKIKSADNDRDFTTVSETQVLTQKEYEDGAAIAQITSDGKLALDYDPEQGNPTYLSIEVAEGTPVVMMSDDMKAAFRTALGI